MSLASTPRAALGGIRLAVAAIAAIAAIPATACKGSSEAPSVSTVDGGGDAALPLVITFAFDPTFACAGGGLCAPPSQVVTVGVSTTREANVTLSLEGSYGDAALTTDHVSTTGGVEPVTLETSSTPTTFTIVARAGSDPSSPTATLAVAVGASGFAMVRATPSYAGKRATPGFEVTAIPQAKCSDVNATPLANATWTSTPNDIPALLPVLADEHVAIAARIGHYATGCADLAPLAASVTGAVTIDVYDVPMALSLTNIDATFTSDSSAKADWQSAMTTAATSVAGGFFGSSSDGTALLDAVRTQVPAIDQAEFDQKRSQGGWDATATSWLSARTPSIHDRASGWLTAAAGTNVGALVVHLSAGPSVGTTTVTPTSLGPLDAQMAGLAKPAPFNWTADADDTVHLAGAVTLSSSPYVAHLADTIAAAAVPNPTSNVPGAIASKIDCQGLATALLGTSDAYGACDASCLGYVCVNALTAEWTTALASPADGSDQATVQLTVGAPAEVGDLAEPQYIQGGWLGQVSGPIVAKPFAAKGTIVGEESSAPTP